MVGEGKSRRGRGRVGAADGARRGREGSSVGWGDWCALHCMIHADHSHLSMQSLSATESRLGGEPLDPSFLLSTFTRPETYRKIK